MAVKTTYKIIFRVKKAYYEQIVAGTKTTEYRANTPYWLKIIKQLNAFIERTQGIKAWLNDQALIPFTAEVANDETNFNIQAVFICAKGQKHVREIVAIGKQVTPSEVKEVVNTPLCFTFYLGNEVKQP